MRVEAPLPEAAQRIRVGHDVFPDAYLLPSHSKIKPPHGNLILLVYDWSKSAMEKHFRNSAKMRIPGSRLLGESEGAYSLIKAAGPRGSRCLKAFFILNRHWTRASSSETNMGTEMRRTTGLGPGPTTGTSSSPFGSAPADTTHLVDDLVSSL